MKRSKRDIYLIDLLKKQPKQVKNSRKSVRLVGINKIKAESASRPISPIHKVDFENKNELEFTVYSDKSKFILNNIIK